MGIETAAKAQSIAGFKKVKLAYKLMISNQN
jgi:hypothetical protein